MYQMFQDIRKDDVIKTLPGKERSKIQLLNISHYEFIAKGPCQGCRCLVHFYGRNSAT